MSIQTVTAAPCPDWCVEPPSPLEDEHYHVGAKTDLSADLGCWVWQSPAGNVGVYVADGYSNGEAGRELGLSAFTIKAHLARIGRRLGSGDRAHLVALAMRTGTIL